MVPLESPCCPLAVRTVHKDAKCSRNCSKSTNHLYRVKNSEKERTFPYLWALPPTTWMSSSSQSSFWVRFLKFFSRLQICWNKYYCNCIPFLWSILLFKFTKNEIYTWYILKISYLKTATNCGEMDLHVPSLLKVKQSNVMFPCK